MRIYKSLKVFTNKHSEKLIQCLEDDMPNTPVGQAASYMGDKCIKLYDTVSIGC